MTISNTMRAFQSIDQARQYLSEIIASDHPSKAVLEALSVLEHVNIVPVSVTISTETGHVYVDWTVPGMSLELDVHRTGGMDLATVTFADDGPVSGLQTGLSPDTAASAITQRLREAGH